MYFSKAQLSRKDSGVLPVKQLKPGNFIHSSVILAFKKCDVHLNPEIECTCVCTYMWKTEKFIVSNSSYEWNSSLMYKIKKQ